MPFSNSGLEEVTIGAGALGMQKACHVQRTVFHITLLIALQPTSIQLLLIPCPCVPESWDVAVDRIQFFLLYHVPGTLEGTKDIDFSICDRTFMSLLGFFLLLL